MAATVGRSQSYNDVEQVLNCRHTSTTATIEWTLERLMVVAYACECCCETGECCQFAFRRLHLGKFGFQAVGSSTSSGGDNKKSPQASMRCCSLWARALTLKAYLPMVPTGCCIVSGKACENQRSRAWPARMSSSWTFLSNALFSQSHTHQDAEPCNDVLV